MKYAILLSLCLVTLGIAGVAAAESGDYSCTTAVGLSNPAFGAALSTPAGNIGGCALVTISEMSTVESVDAADGCSISVDIDGDGLSDADAEAGTAYPSGSSFTAYCDLGVVDATSTITLTSAEGR